MNDIIHLLPDSVANQIAAGEVVQRPSSIIKEMMENSIDAGATNVKVLVVDGGKTNVQVIDNGKGMSETDARLAFDRHATSKIEKASDLFNLSTMGFRGEALASIAAVAQVELKTKREDDELGTMIQISGSKIEKQEPVVCPTGSNFSVQNIFFNVPARRRFLKSNQTELNNVVSDFQRIVLVYPHISFSLFNNGVEMYHLPQGSLKQRIVDVFGKKINADILPIEVETSLVSISGYVGKPECSKKKGVQQFFFVNGRYMRHPYFHSAVMKAFEGLIPAGNHVPYFIYFSVEASTIDVNVHPTKTEIKFDNEQPIWQVLSAAVRETIGQFCNVPLIDFDIEGKPDIPTFGTTASIPRQPKEPSSSYNPFNSGEGKLYSRSNGWEKLYDDITPSGASKDLESFDSSDLSLDSLSSASASLGSLESSNVALNSEGSLGSLESSGVSLDSLETGSSLGSLESSGVSFGTIGSSKSSLGSLGDSSSSLSPSSFSSGRMPSSFSPFGEERESVLGASGLNFGAVMPNLDDIPEEKNLQGSLWNELSSENGTEKTELDFSVPKIQYKGRYIILPTTNGLMVVNQHRAHVRVLFDENMRFFTSENRPSQKELFPIVVQFDVADAMMMEEMMEDVVSLGFDLSNLGSGSYSVNGIPSGLDGVDVDLLLHEMVQSVKEHTSNIRKDAQESLALTMAERSAIVYGQVLSSLEMERLLKDLFSSKTPARTPNGKVVYKIIEDKVINDGF